MDLIRISDNQMINADLIESVETRTVKGQRMITLVVGGKSYTPDMDSMELMKLLIKSGVSKSSNQFFAV